MESASINKCFLKINSKDLLYDTKSYIKYLVINYNQKNWKIKIETYITESLCCTLETNTSLQINYTPILISQAEDYL